MSTACRYSKSAVRKAGERIVKNGSRISESDYRLVFEWRAAHLQPLEKTMNGIHSVCGVDDNSVLVGRLKRLDTIINKLRRPGTDHELDRLGDISGCRLIVSCLADVYQAAEALTTSGLVTEHKKDYIATPKPSGYRGIHLETKFDAGFKNIATEIQIRDRWQHYWATAVELYDMSTNAGLKTGNAGPKTTEYFRVLSDIIANIDAGRPVDVHEQCRLIELDGELGVNNILREASDSVFLNSIDRYSDTSGHVDISSNGSGCCLITLQEEMQTLDIVTFPESCMGEALKQYALKEEALRETKRSGSETYLLARAASVESLKLAYPNYFANMDELLKLLADLLHS